MDGLRRFIQKIGILIGVNVIYLLFLAACFLLPVEPIVKNVETSLEVFVDAKEGTENPIFDKTYTLYWDTFSDMIWVNMATVAGENPIISAIRLDYYSGGEAPWDNLVNSVYYRDSASLQNYSRYWNINVGVLKIFFSFMSISDIRFLLYWIIIGLLFLLLYRISKLQGAYGCIPIIAAFMMTALELHAMCLSFFGDIFVTLVFMIALTYLCPRMQGGYDEGQISLLFMVMGSMVYAVGPLVAPVMSVGMCLVIWLQLQKENVGQKILWKKVVINTVWWIVGYGITMLLKQVLSKIIIGKQDGVEEALMWFGTEMAIRDRFVLLGDKLIRCFTPITVKLPVFLFGVGILIFLGLRRKCRSNKDLQLAFIALYPVLWVLIVSRHSIHYFTSNIFAVSVYAIFSILVNHILVKGSGFKYEKNKKDFV